MPKGPGDDYVEVADRIREFREKHPEGSLRPVNPEKPYHVQTIGEQTFVVYCAAAYRTPEDPCPGVGTAWEPFPGPTPFTRDSELQNAETSAWGRAIVATLAADTRRGVASAQEVRNRSSNGRRPKDAPELTEAQVQAKQAVLKLEGEAKKELKEWWREQGFPERFSELTDDQAKQVAATAKTVDIPF